MKKNNSMDTSNEKQVESFERKLRRGYVKKVLKKNLSIFEYQQKTTL